MFDLVDLLRYLRARWLVFAVAWGVGGVLAMAISLLLPRQYTATAEVLIEPPAGNDPRAATAVSPTYLESLKAYERLASSDSLFLDALRKVDPEALRNGTPVEAIKRRVLRVNKPSNTAMLEISATMPDPRAAQALVQLLANKTVEVGNSIDTGPRADLTRDLEVQLNASRSQVTDVRRARDALSSKEPIEALDNELQAESELKSKIGADLATARADLAAQLADAQQPTKDPAESDRLARETARGKARVAALEKQEGDLAADISAKGSRLEGWRGRRNDLDEDEKTAQATWAKAATRVGETLESLQLRGERLRVIDPGIVPQAPSAPNVPLDVMAAVILSLAAAFIFLTVRFSFERISHKEIERVFSLER